MPHPTYLVEFENVSEAQAQTLAADLQNRLLDAHRDIQVERRRKDPTAQDFGATLAIVLAAPAVVALVEELGKWLKKYNDCTLVFTRKADGESEVLVKHLNSKNFRELLPLLKDLK